MGRIDRLVAAAGADRVRWAMVESSSVPGSGPTLSPLAEGAGAGVNRQVSARSSRPATSMGSKSRSERATKASWAKRRRYAARASNLGRPLALDTGSG